MTEILKSKIKKIALWFGIIFVVSHIFIVVFYGLVILSYNYFNPPFATIQIYRWVLNGYEPQDKIYMPLKQIPKKIRKFVVAAEDYRFYEHEGIDVEAMYDAWEKNQKAGYHKYGASTLTQQLTRTLFLFPNKLLLRKYVEIIISLEMDLILSKERILELYLNNAEWGQGVYGVPAAAQYYFKKDIRKLSGEEMVKLVVILPNPVKYDMTNFYKNKILNHRYRVLRKLAN